jgi:hypothetical protein
MFSGYCMYTGVVFALIGVAVWLGAYRLSGFGAALISQVVLLVARKIWFTVRAQQPI